MLAQGMQRRGLKESKREVVGKIGIEIDVDKRGSLNLSIMGAA
jgi:hypothetical protein